MAVTLADRPLHKLSVDDVLRMLESGVIDEDSRVELLEGVLVEMRPKSPQHGAAILRIDEWLLPLRIAGGHWVRFEQPIVVAALSSMPEPDISVVDRGTDLRSLAETALLVVEVSISSLRIDREVKAPLYASAGVPDYWIVDVEHRRVEVRREPANGGYSSVETLGPADSVAPVALDLPPLVLSTIF